MEARKIVVRPARAVVEHEAVPVTRTIVTERPMMVVKPATVVRQSPAVVMRTPAGYEVQHEEVVLAPNEPVEPAANDALQYWTERLAPSIGRMLPTPDHQFTATGVSVQREEFFRDEVEMDAAYPNRPGIPRRVRVRRQRVTLYGTVDRAP